MTNPILQIDDLVVDYPQSRGRGTFRALSGVSLHVGPGECLGVVGESGSGKSTLGKAVLGLVPVGSGRVFFDGSDITGATRAQRRRLSRDLQVVFQDPYGSLDPTMSIGEILLEPLMVAGVSKTESRSLVRDILERVQLPASAAVRYPREFSGGQRQRVAIARALVRLPRLVICDEPVSALDLSTQNSIIDLLIELQRETGVAYMFVSHDLDVVRQICHRVVVMHRGEIVECGEGREVTTTPRHPYSQRLLLASPVADPVAQAARRDAWLALRDGPGRGDTW